MTRRDWLTAFTLAVLIMLLTTIPYLIGFATQTPEYRFGGFMFGVDDGNSYLAKMRQGGMGSWTFTISYTTEPHRGEAVFLPYLVMGKIAAFIAPPESDSYVGAMLLVFHTARIVFGVALIVTCYRFAALFLASGAQRILVTVLIALGGGLGWLLILTGNDNLLGSSPVDVYIPEGYGFYVLYGLPHIALARTAMLWGVMLLGMNRHRTPRPDDSTSADSPSPFSERRLRGEVIAGFLFLIMGLCVPFYIAVLYAVLGVWGVAVWLHERRFPTDLFRRAVIAALIPFPYFAYNLSIVTVNDVIRIWQAQNVLPSPHPLHYVFGYGVLAIFAAIAIPAVWKTQSRLHWLLPAWVIAAPFLAYVPVSVQRRLLEGVFVPLCILAVIGLWQVRSRLLTVIVVLLVLPTTLLLLFSGAITAARPGEGNRLFNNTTVIDALNWLNANAPAGSAILSSVGIGNLAPAYADVRSFVGHGPETIRFGDKEAIMLAYFAGEYDAERRAELYLQNDSQHGIRYVISTGSLPFELSQTERPIYNMVAEMGTGGVVIYQVAQ
jgi:hypothetical protein